MEKKREGYLLIIGYLGTFLTMIGLIVLMPLIILFFYPSEANLAVYFLIPGVTTILVGYLLSLINYRRELERLKNHEDVLLLVLIWLAAILISSLPLYLTKEYSFSEAVFEMTSGYTTTGMSLYQFSNASKIFLFFRSITHFFGGVGLVLVLTSTISDKFGIQLYKAEGHNDRLLPNLVKSARFIFLIYSIYILVGTILYIIFGMNLFDAINHAISAVSTGGFSTKASSIAYYNSVPIEIITMILMLLGATNFMIHMFLIKKQFKKALNHIEIKFLFVYGILLTGLLMLTNVYKFSSSLRYNTFYFVSAMSSTGFLNNTKSFISYSNQFLILLAIIMAIGGGMGSTAGGIKHFRIALLFKSIKWNLKEKYNNPRLIESKQYYYLNVKRQVDSKEIINNYSLISIYLLILFVASIIVTSFGFPFINAIFEVSSLLGNSGLSIGIMTSTNNPLLLWLGTFIMLLGRLEVYPIILALMKGLKDIKTLIK